MQDAHLFHETIAENLHAKNDATKDEMRAACEAAKLETIDHYLMV